MAAPLPKQQLKTAGNLSVILYIDTSALLKRYVREAQSDVVATAIQDAREITLSVVAYAEMRAAFARKLREGTLSHRDHDFSVRSLDRD